MYAALTLLKEGWNKNINITIQLKLVIVVICVDLILALILLFGHIEEGIASGTVDPKTTSGLCLVQKRKGRVVHSPQSHQSLLQSVLLESSPRHPLEVLLQGLTSRRCPV